MWSDRRYSHAWVTILFILFTPRSAVSRVEASGSETRQRWWGPAAGSTAPPPPPSPRQTSFWGGSSTASSSSSLPRSSLPRSRNHNAGGNNSNNRASSALSSLRHRVFPPWNLSHRIDERGFLKALYRRVPGDWEPEVKLRTAHSLTERCRIRQVPGDGNCLFHSISLSLRHAQNGTHWRLEGSDSLEELYRHSHELRQQAVRCLASPTRRLFLQGRESLRATELVRAAADQYQLTPEEYCASMSQSSVWGGGPEIVALCNLLQRPIHVYELATAVMQRSSLAAPSPSPAASRRGGGALRERAAAPPPAEELDCGEDGDERSGPSTTAFVLRRMACFGSPKFDHRVPLHILSADSRFPDISPGHQLSSGNHFLAVFPTQRKRATARRGTGGRKLMRGGAAAAATMEGAADDDAGLYNEYDFDENADDCWDGEIVVLEKYGDAGGQGFDGDNEGFYESGDDDYDESSLGPSLSRWMRSWCGRLWWGRRPFW